MHTHTQARTHALAHSHSRTHTHALTLTHSHARTHTRARTLAHALAHARTRARMHTHAHKHTHPHWCPPTRSRTLPRTHATNLWINVCPHMSSVCVRVRACVRACACACVGVLRTASVTARQLSGRRCLRRSPSGPGIPTMPSPTRRCQGKLVLLPLEGTYSTAYVRQGTLRVLIYRLSVLRRR
jgi:hypothetical protein